MEKIGIIPADYFLYDRGEPSGATHVRIDPLVRNYPEYEKWGHGKRYDRLIFQQFFWGEMMRAFQGPKILDLCDPDWNHYDLDIIERGHLVHAITCSSPELTRLVQSYFPGKSVVHIPDRLDLENLPAPRQSHRGRIKNAVWFGYMRNARETLPQLASDLRKHGIGLTIISESPYTGDDEITALKPRFIPYGHRTVCEQIKEADIMLNPRSGRAFFKYKSNNKSLLSWALGVPVAANSDDIIRLTDPENRRKEVVEKQKMVREEYGIEKSAKQYNRLFDEIRERFF